ncbi:MAG TPA: T9SS type A sorting domain-containing protein [Flavobacteriales bacterium]|jgi:hypothetical protein|nr:T9SS type A sorting domain-containing protein [Flavobacteriales bacterium]MBK6548940.1 T9SS type A sorting domain-containing protein [Flavobacteriales bacterium]MBK7100863.1 T9SS type A sorting domain-containing protein [Flavobacteriales bacterium]MBK7484091.1 T9SS type A sorting domain-containing protein [Flavobacteriales bacterium]MBK7618415.1 T9SS type A sorting domain-containing protein [Flavobacteriales bacterium]
MIGLRIGLMALAFVGNAVLCAQEHPYLSHFDLTEGDGQVTLDWTMVSGNTCDGTRILRSRDSLNFEEIGVLSGLCGSITTPTFFRHADLDPPELTTAYYRLELGSNGSSSIQRIDLKRLYSVEHRIFPSPMPNNGTLLLRVDPEVRVGLRIWSTNGRLVHDVTGHGDRLEVPSEAWPAGVYVYEATVENKRLRGRFVVL